MALRRSQGQVIEGDSTQVDAAAGAMEEWAARQCGQQPYPVQYDDQGESCLSCQARKAVEQFMDAPKF